MLLQQPCPTGSVPIDMQVHWDNRDVTVVLAGELDCASAPDLSALLTELIAKRPQRLVLDLANVVFMDCAGITPIARARRALPAAGRSSSGPLPARPARLLKITRMDQLFLIQDDLPRSPASPPAGDGWS